MKELMKTIRGIREMNFKLYTNIKIVNKILMTLNLNVFRWRIYHFIFVFLEIALCEAQPMYDRRKSFL